jgi:hypothetical protein
MNSGRPHTSAISEPNPEEGSQSKIPVDLSYEISVRPHTSEISEPKPEEVSQSRVPRESSFSSSVSSGHAQPKHNLTRVQNDLLLLALHGVASLFESTAPTTNVEQILVLMQSNAPRDTVQTLIQELNFTDNNLHEALEFVMNQTSIRNPIELEASISCRCTPHFIDQSRARSLNMLRVTTDSSCYSLEDCLMRLYTNIDCHCKSNVCFKASLKYEPTRCPNVLILELDKYRTWHASLIREEFDLSKAFASYGDNSIFSLEAIVSIRAQSFYKHEGTWKDRFTQEPILFRDMVKVLSDFPAILFYKKMSYSKRFQSFDSSSFSRN